MLTEGQRQVRQMVRRFAQDELAPGAAERDRVPRFPREAFAAMAELGMMGMVVPEQYGGAGLDYVSYALAVMEIAAADGGISTAFQVHNSLVCLALLNYGTDAQKERWVDALAEGRGGFAFGITEPAHGSDATYMETTATRA